jgi:hypothetical protein
MRLHPFDRDGSAAACRLPADAAGAAGCDSLVALRFPGGAGTRVLEGTVPRGRRACWTVRLEARRRLEVRLSSTGGGGASVEVRSLTAQATWPGAGGWPFSSGACSISSTSVGGTSVSSTSVSSTTTGGGASVTRVSAGRNETLVSVGPQSSGGEFLLAVTAAQGGDASYRLEVRVR